MTPEQRWMTTDEAAQKLGVSRSTVQRWLKEQRLSGNRIGKRWLVLRSTNTDLTVKEAAHLLRAHPDTVRRWLAEGKLPGHRVGRQWRVSQAQVISLIEGSTTTGYEISSN
jgi:excisionase family DNA binding protein